jgi:hypothetical protein
VASRYGVNPKTVAKWRKRSSAADLRTGPKEPGSTVLSVENEAIIVAFRRHTPLPLDDCLYALQATIPHLTRSSSSPSKISPFLISPIMSAPKIVPATVPTPPNRLVPPSTAAAITESSSPSPSWNRPEWRRLAYNIPAMDAALEESSRTRILIAAGR